MSNSTSVLGEKPIDPDLDPGQVVGEYQVEGKLGQGGFGAVFKAVHPLIGKVVAIKVLARKFSVDPEMVSRFVAEAKAVNQIRNRHIIDIFSFGQLPDGRSYYVMEYLEGEPLDKLLDREGRLPLPQALPILRAIARALDAAHAKGIAHRDLKPENVFLAKDESGESPYWPKLLDFGIAKLMGGEEANKHKTRTGMPIGTPYYMSPEQCRGKDVDHRTDYYAFGVLTYQMLTGAFPIDADDFMTILMRQITDEPAPASSVNPELPAGVDAAIAWLMSKDPAQRPPNLVAAMRALEEAAEHAGIAVPRAPISAPIAIATARSTDMGRAAIAAATTMPSGAPVGPVLEARARSKRTVLVAAGLGALALGAGVFYVMSRPSSAAAPAHAAAAAPAAGSPAAAPVPAPAHSAPRPAAAPAAQPAAQPAAPAPAPAATTVPRDIQLAIDGAPAGTEIVLDHRVLGTAPGPIAVPRGEAAITLELRHAGYVSEQRKLVPDQDQHLAVKLRPRHASAAPTHAAHAPAHDSHDIEDPFAH